MSIVKNSERVSNFTSSKISKLIPLGNRPMTEEELKAYKEREPKGRKKNIDAGFTAGGLTYIKQKRQEAKRKRSMSLDPYSKAIAWGHLCELRVYDMIGLEYKIESRTTTRHPRVPHWSGSNDLIVVDVKIGEIKCYYPENFCSYADVLIAKDLERFRDEFPDEYWQIVSNTCIHDVPNGEAILYQPYDSEASEICELIDRLGDEFPEDAWKYRYIWEAIHGERIHELPFQPDDSEYPNLVTWEFEVPVEDKKFLEERIVEATVLLNE